jgi:serine/threonine protein kinase
MKVLQKKKIESEGLYKYCLTERHVLSMTSHPFLVKLQFAFQNQQQLFLVMEYCSGGDLGKYLAKRKRLREEEARVYAAEIVLAIGHLHD